MAAVLLGFVSTAAFAQALSQVAPPAAEAAPARPETPFIKPATIDDTLEVTGEAIRAKQINSRMLVGVTIDGKGPFGFFVDSGADRTVVGQALAQRLGLEPGPAVMLNSMSGAKLTPTARIGTLKVGTSEIHDISAPPLPERFLAADGLLGIDALAEQRLNIDFERRRVTIQDNQAREQAGGSDEVVVVARRRKGQLILTQASAAGTRIAAVIDTGSEVTIGNSALRARLLRRNQARFQTATLVSVTGESMIADMLVVPELRIGGVLFERATIAFVDVPPFRLFGLDKEPAILLGTDLLEGFRRVSLDFRRRKVRFTMRADGTAVRLTH